jgi:hypothetical protein
MSDNIVSHAFFSVSIGKDVYQHPFVRDRVIPALKETHKTEILSIVRRNKPFITGMNKPKEELENLLWFNVLSEVIRDSIKKFGDDRGLGFGLLGGGASNYLIWDNLYKNLYPSFDFSFSLPLLTDDKNHYGYNDGTVYLRGAQSTAYRNGQRISVIRIYFYHDIHEKRDVGAETISTNVGLLCEVPFFFLRSDRYETFADEDATNNLLDLFELTKSNLFDSPLDFIPTNELGDMTHDASPVVIGNNFASLNIR